MMYAPTRPPPMYDEVGLKGFLQILFEREGEMNTTLEEEREEEQRLLCFDRADPIAMIRLDRRISLSHMPPLVSLNLFRLSRIALGLFSCDHFS